MTEIVRHGIAVESGLRKIGTYNGRIMVVISCFVREFVHSFLRIRYTWLAAPFRKMADADTVEAVRKELQSVKSKAVGKIKALQAQVDTLQQQLSERAEVSRKSINAIENGVYVPSTVLALKIARTLRCSVEDLFRLPTR